MAAPGDDPHELTPAYAQARANAMLEEHWAVLVWTRSGAGACHGRPMARARTDPDGTIHFLTRVDSSALPEIEANTEMSLALERGHEYAILRGTGTATHDHPLIQRVWDPSWSVWFPRGPEDRAIAIVAFVPLEGRYWDVSRTRGVSFYYRPSSRPPP
jgi:general stress protein 26